MAMKSSDKQATAELLAVLVEIAIAHGRRHYSKSGEPLATTLAVPRRTANVVKFRVKGSHPGPMGQLVARTAQ